MGGAHRVRRVISEGQADSLALAISKADAQGARAMEPYWREETKRPKLWLRVFRLEVKRILNDPEIRVSKVHRDVMNRFVAEFGLQTHDVGEPMTAMLDVQCTDAMKLGARAAASRQGMSLADWVRAAVAEKLERDKENTPA